MLDTYRKATVGLVACLTMAGYVLPSAGFASKVGSGTTKSTSKGSTKSSSSTKSSGSKSRSSKSSAQQDEWADKKIVGGRYPRP